MVADKDVQVPVNLCGGGDQPGGRVGRGEVEAEVVDSGVAGQGFRYRRDKCLRTVEVCTPGLFFIVGA